MIGVTWRAMITKLSLWLMRTKILFLTVTVSQKFFVNTLNFKNGTKNFGETLRPLKVSFSRQN